MYTLWFSQQPIVVRDGDFPDQPTNRPTNRWRQVGMISCCGPDGSSRREGGGVNVDKSLVRIGSGFVSFHVGLIRSVVSVPFLVPLLPRVVFLDLFES